MKPVASCVAACLFILSASALASDPPKTLPPVVVVGNYCSVAVCKYVDYFGAFFFPEQGPVLPTDAAKVGTKDDKDKPKPTCKALQDFAKKGGCDTANPPSVPNIPSPTRDSWVTNGCGTGAVKEHVAVEAIAIAAKVPYTGNMTTPLPGVSFAGACDTHDKCYYTGVKSECDGVLWSDLKGVCASVGSTDDCMLFAVAYTKAVKNYGQDAYDEDHADQRCAQLAKDIKDQKNCVDSAVGPA